MLAIRCVGALLIFFAMFEACARVDDAWSEGAPLLGRYDQSVLMATDEFGLTGQPHAHFAKWRMNSLGLRGPELRSGVKTILCIGASETFGLYEPEGMEFPRQMERDIPRYQVANAALPGQSLSSFARRAVKVSRLFRPSIAVIYPSLAIYIDPPPDRLVANAQTQFQLRTGRKLFALLSDRISPAVQTFLNRAMIRIEAPPASVLKRIPESSVERFRHDLSRLIDLLETEHVRVLLVTHATRFGWVPQPGDAAMLTAWRALHPRLQEDGFADMENRLNQVIRAESLQRHLPLVDAASWLRGGENFVEFVHFTQQGAAALAKAIANEINRMDRFGQTAIR